MSKKKTIKVKFWTYTPNNGDGSYGIKFFSSKEAAEEYASYDDERACDDIRYVELEVDLDGNLVGPDPEADEWAKEAAARRWEEDLKRRKERNAYYQKMYPKEKSYFTCPKGCKHTIKDDYCRSSK